MQYSYPPHNADWTKELRGKRVIAPAKLLDYLVVFTRRDGEKAQDFVSTLQRVGPPMGMQVGRPNMVELPTDKTDVLMDHITSNLRQGSTQLVGVSEVPEAYKFCSHFPGMLLASAYL
jgi:aubergine-like protein